MSLRLAARRSARSALLAVLALCPFTQALAELPPLIPREILFGNPERNAPRLSPDGKRLAYLAADKANVLQVWVRTLGQADDKVVTADKKRGIRNFKWAEDNRTLLYTQDVDGDENFHIYGVDLESGNVRDYTPFQGVRAQLMNLNPKFPDQLLVSLNLRKREIFDVYRVSLRTGAVELDTENPGDVASWVTDSKMVVRGAMVVGPDGGPEIRIRDGAKAPWRSWMKAGAEEEIGLYTFTADGKAAFVETTLGSDTSRLVERNLQTGAEKLIAQSPKVDVGFVEIHPTRYVVQAVGFGAGRVEWTIVDPSVKEDFEAFARISDGEPSILNRDRADATWLVAFAQDRGPTKFYVYDRKEKKGTYLFSQQSKLEGLALAEMKHVVIPARDGLELSSFLTLPVGVPAKGLPMVLLVHGGPWARDTWGLHNTVQWLANRGYAVLQVNYRGSTGFGKKFVNAGNRQWGLATHDDLIDAVNWAVKEGVADPKRVAIMGTSYGGYAALAGATFTPDVFRCSVDVCGPANLFTLLKAIPPYWKTIKGVFDTRVGRVDDPADAELLRKASPLFSAERIKIPMLIGQGANDPRVPKAEAEQIVAAIEKNGKKATYVLYTDEGHGFLRPENRLDFNARVEAFLAENLGGRLEPLKADKVPGSTAVVKVVGGGASPAPAPTANKGS